jgi:hypothetical protein
MRAIAFISKTAIVRCSLFGQLKKKNASLFSIFCESAFGISFWISPYMKDLSSRRLVSISERKGFQHMVDYHFKDIEEMRLCDTSIPILS